MVIVDTDVESAERLMVEEPFAGIGLRAVEDLARWMKLGIDHERGRAGRPQEKPTRADVLHYEEDTTKPASSH